MSDKPTKPSREKMIRLLRTAEPPPFDASVHQSSAAYRSVTPEDKQYVGELSVNMFHISELAHTLGKEINELTDGDLVGTLNTPNAKRTLRMLQQPISPEEQLQFDHQSQLAGGSYKVPAGSVTGEYVPEGVIDYQARFSEPFGAMLHKPDPYRMNTPDGEARRKIDTTGADTPPPSGASVYPTVVGQGQEKPRETQK